ncbi:MAG TPA: GH3 auxin-responsive promoter family protein [Opitutaceae bacterium]|nr:GH3 auxin-responsive promoter family protein [Opitutaceae bacterium]
MPAWPKSIIMFGASALTARMAMRLRRSDSEGRAQSRAYRSLIRRLGTTTYWRAAGIRPAMSYEEFRRGVAPRTYDSLSSAIARTEAGEADVLWPGCTRLFAASSGTSNGESRRLPVSVEMLKHFRAGCRDSLLYYTARRGQAGVLRGRHLFLTGSTALHAIGDGPPHRAFAGEWPAIAALNLPRWAESDLYEPGAAIGALTDWPAKLDAIITRTSDRDISLIAGMPPWVLNFTETLRTKRTAAGRPIESLAALWPNLECLVHGGMAVGPYQNELRAALGPNVNFHEIFAAAEGIFAAQDGPANAGLRIMANLGIFFEFLPFSEYDEHRLESLGDKAVTLRDVKPGVDYVLLLTTPAGLARYVIGDIVRFTSTRPPRLHYIGRTSLQLAAFGERVLEKDVTDALLAVCGRHRWTIVNFHVAPLLGTDLTGQTRGRHEWWVELKPGTVETPTGPQMAVELDLELQRLHREYAVRRGSGRIEAPTVRLVMPGVFRHWMRYHKRIGGQYKIARCRGDRVVADELAQITKFARD